jgi:hypothetical protein
MRTLSLRLLIGAAAVAALTTPSAWAQAVRYFDLSPLTFTPPHVYGDRDFKGHGPVVQSWVRLRVNPYNRRQILMQASLLARETRRDWTTAQGWTPEVAVWTARYPVRGIWDSGYRLYRNSVEYYHGYTDGNHQIDTFYNPHPLALQINYVGDTRGNEAGTRTRMDVYFNRIWFLE